MSLSVASVYKEMEKMKKSNDALLESCREVLKAVYFEKSDGQWYPTADFNDAIPMLSQAIANCNADTK